MTSGGVDLAGVSMHFARRGETVAALDCIDLHVAPGEFVAVLGPSGCGKTTLLRLIDGLIEPAAGTISIDAAPPQPGPDIGVVFQGFRLIPWATVSENIAFALTATTLSADERAARVSEVIALVGMHRFATAYPGDLSGGMKQRVALARALVVRPKVLLMDEPFASLDAQSRELMQRELAHLWSLRRPTVILVTHSVDEALTLADRVVLMAPRPGRIVDDLAVDLPRPRDSGLHAHATFIALRQYLSDRLRALVLADPASDFYQRGL